MEECVAMRNVQLHVFQAFQEEAKALPNVLPRDSSFSKQLRDGLRIGVALRSVVETAIHQPLEALLRLSAAGLGLVPILDQLITILVLAVILADFLDVCLVPNNLTRPATSGHAMARVLAGVDVLRSCTCNCGREHRICARALRLLSGLGNRVLSDLLLGLGRLLEDLLLPRVLPQIQQVLDLELYPLAEGGRAVRGGAALELHQAGRELRHQQLAVLRSVEGVTDRLQQLANTLDHVLLRQALLDTDKVMHDLTDDFHGQQLSQEEIADEFHVGQHFVLAFLHLDPQVVWRQLALFLLRGFERRGQVLKLVLARVQQHTCERLRLLTLVLRRELGIPCPQGVDHVGVGLAVVRLGERLLHDEADDRLELLAGGYLGVDDPLGDRGDVVGRDLVQVALDLPPELLVAALGRADLVSVRRGSGQRLPGPSCSPVSAVSSVSVAASSLAVTQAVAAEHGTVRGVVVVPPLAIAPVAVAVAVALGGVAPLPVVAPPPLVAGLQAKDVSVDADAGAVAEVGGGGGLVQGPSASILLVSRPQPRVAPLPPTPRNATEAEAEAQALRLSGCRRGAMFRPVPHDASLQLWHVELPDVPRRAGHPLRILA
mmetsp:Transcript_12591/g.31737  ORF Transcript_12591/g.31737 Transcript_12591/m.31737 type:complete len:602 (-) Transcript_12591:1009-2814(-)